MIAADQGIIKSTTLTPIPASPMPNPLIVATKAPARANVPVRSERELVISRLKTRINIKTQFVTAHSIIEEGSKGEPAAIAVILSSKVGMKILRKAVPNQIRLVIILKPKIISFFS